MKIKKNKYVLIHMSDDHFIIENQDNNDILEFKGKYARVEAYSMMNRLTRRKYMIIQDYEDLFYVYEKFLKSDKCKTLDDAKNKFKELQYAYFETEEDKMIEEHLDKLDEQYNNTEIVNGYDCDGTPCD